MKDCSSSDGSVVASEAVAQYGASDSHQSQWWGWRRGRQVSKIVCVSLCLTVSSFSLSFPPTLYILFCCGCMCVCVVACVCAQDTVSLSVCVCVCVCVCCDHVYTLVSLQSVLYLLQPNESTESNKNSTLALELQMSSVIDTE